jgi:hypothetical protein
MDNSNFRLMDCDPIRLTEVEQAACVPNDLFQQ